MVCSSDPALIVLTRLDHNEELYEGHWVRDVRIVLQLVSEKPLRADIRAGITGIFLMNASMALFWRLALDEPVIKREPYNGSLGFTGDAVMAIQDLPSVDRSIVSVCPLQELFLSFGQTDGTFRSTIRSWGGAITMKGKVVLIISQLLTTDLSRAEARSVI